MLTESELKVCVSNAPADTVQPQLLLLQHPLGVCVLSDTPSATARGLFAHSSSSCCLMGWCSRKAASSGLLETSNLAQSLSRCTGPPMSLKAISAGIRSRTASGVAADVDAGPQMRAIDAICTFPQYRTHFPSIVSRCGNVDGFFACGLDPFSAGAKVIGVPKSVRVQIAQAAAGQPARAHGC